LVFFFSGAALLLYRTLRKSQGHFVIIAGFACTMGAFFGFKDSSLVYFKQVFQVDPAHNGLFLTAESGWKVVWQLIFSLAISLAISPRSPGRSLSHCSGGSSLGCRRRSARAKC
jgi:hypothetical protein